MRIDFYVTDLDRDHRDVVADIRGYLDTLTVLTNIDTPAPLMLEPSLSIEVDADQISPWGGVPNYARVTFSDRSSTPPFPSGLTGRTDPRYVYYFVTFDTSRQSTRGSIPLRLDIDAWATFLDGRAIANSGGVTLMSVDGLLQRGHAVTSDYGDTPRLDTQATAWVFSKTQKAWHVRPVYAMSATVGDTDIKSGFLLVSPTSTDNLDGLPGLISREVRTITRNDDLAVLLQQSAEADPLPFQIGKQELLSVFLIPANVPFREYDYKYTAGAIAYNPTARLSAAGEPGDTLFYAVGAIPDGSLSGVPRQTLAHQITLEGLASTPTQHVRVGNAATWIEVGENYPSTVNAACVVSFFPDASEVSVNLECCGERVDLTDSLRASFGTIADADGYATKGTTDALRAMSTVLGVGGSILTGSPVGIAQSVLGAVDFAAGIATRSFSASTHSGAAVYNAAVAKTNGTRSFVGAVGVYTTIPINLALFNREIAAYGYYDMFPVPRRHNVVYDGGVATYYELDGHIAATQGINPSDKSAGGDATTIWQGGTYLIPMVEDILRNGVRVWWNGAANVAGRLKDWSALYG